jgi:hypothetical protein
MISHMAQSVQLSVGIATTATGSTYLDTLTTTGPGDGTTEPMTGLGDKAVYWEDAGINTRGVAARVGCYGVDVTAYFLEPPPTKEQLAALVNKAIDAL